MNVREAITRAPKALRCRVTAAQGYADKRGRVVRVYATTDATGFPWYGMTSFNNHYRHLPTVEIVFPRSWPYVACVDALTNFMRGR